MNPPKAKRWRTHIENPWTVRKHVSKLPSSYNGLLSIPSLAETFDNSDFARNYGVSALIAPHKEGNKVHRGELQIMCGHTEIANIYFSDVYWIMVARHGWQGREELLEALRSHVLDHVKETSQTDGQSPDDEGRGRSRSRQRQAQPIHTPSAATKPPGTNSKAQSLVILTRRSESRPLLEQLCESLGSTSSRLALSSGDSDRGEAEGSRAYRREAEGKHADRREAERSERSRAHRREAEGTRAYRRDAEGSRALRGEAEGNRAHRREAEGTRAYRREAEGLRAHRREAEGETCRSAEQRRHSSLSTSSRLALSNGDIRRARDAGQRRHSLGPQTIPREV